MAEVSVGSWRHRVARVEVLLRPGSGPVVRLVLPKPDEGADSSEPLYEALGTGVRGRLSWRGSPLEFVFLGYRPYSRLDLAPEEAAIVGLVLREDVLDWFESGPSPESASLRDLVYQRGPGSQDGSAWAVFDRMLGPDICRRPMGLQGLDASFPEGACFVRPPERKNIEHLNHCVALLAETTVRARGWAAFDDPKSPVRIVGLEADPFVLDASWRLRGGSHFVHAHPLAPRVAAAPPAYLVRRWGELDHAKVADLLVLATQSGLPDTLGKGVVGEPNQLPYCPGPAKIGDLSCYIEAIRYSCDVLDEGVPCTLMAEVSFGFPPIPQTQAAQFESEALFGEWASEGDLAGKRVALRPVGQGASWVVMDDLKTQARDQKLFARPLTPYAARGEFGGFYVAYQPDDPLLVRVREGGIPLALGGLQVFSDNLEIAELTLNSASVHLSGRERTGAQEDADGVQVDGDSEEVRVIAGQKVDVKQGKMVVTEETTTLTHDLAVEGAAVVQKKVELKATLDVGE